MSVTVNKIMHPNMWDLINWEEFSQLNPSLESQSRNKVSILPSEIKPDLVGITPSLGIIKKTFSLKDAFSGKNTANLLGETAKVLGTAASTALSGGRSSGVGNALQGLQGIASAIPGSWGGVASAGLGIASGLTNRFVGSQLNKEYIKEIENSNKELSNIKVNDSSNESILNQFGNINFGKDVNASLVGKDGVFNHAASDETNRLRNEQADARLNALLSLNNGVSNVNTQTGLNLLANSQAYGGPIEMRTSAPMSPFGNRFEAGGDLSTHGAIFNNGLSFINNGGTHEKNPLTGVPIGVDQEGTPNLVEEGEVVWNDYVFSNRLEVPKEVKENMKLKGKKLTFADAVKQIEKESEERPNDPISKRGLENSLNKLMSIQESIRQQEQMKQLAALQATNQAYALGGNLFWDGGNSISNNDPPAGYNDASAKVAMEKYFYEFINGKNGEVDFEAMHNPEHPYMKNANIFLTYFDEPWMKPYRDKYYQEIIDDNTKWGWAGIKEERTVEGLQEAFSPKRPSHKIDLEFNVMYPKRLGAWHNVPKISDEDIEKYVKQKDIDNYIREYGIEEYRGISNPEDTSITKDKNTPPKENKDVELNTTPKSKFDSSNLSLDLNYPSASPSKKSFEDRVYDTYHRELTKPFEDVDLNTSLGRFIALEKMKENQKFEFPSLLETLYSKNKNDVNTNTSDTSEEPYEFKESPYRFAPVVGSALGAIQNVLSKPDYSRAERLEREALRAGNYTPSKYKPINNYLTYNPFDTEYYANQLGAQAAATRRNIENLSGANRSVAIGNLLASDYNAQNQLGELYKKANEYNLAQREKIEGFNRDTNKVNADLLSSNNALNQDAFFKSLGLRMDGVNRSLAMKEAIDAAKAQSLNANITGVFEGLGDIGRENTIMKIIKNNPSLLYDSYGNYKRNSTVQNSESKKNGGFLTIKNKKRKR